MTPTWLQSYLPEQAFCDRFATVLAHFVWQATVLALLVVIMQRLLRTASSRLRYALSLIVMLAMLGCFPVTYLWIARDGSTSQFLGVSSNLHQPAIPVDTRSIVAVDTPGSSLAASITPAGPMEDVPAMSMTGLATVAYLIGATVMLLRLAIALRGGQRLQRASTTVDDPLLLGTVARLSSELGLKCVPAIACCQRVAVPVVVGVIRPTLLIPTTLVTGLPIDQLQSILVHELSHIRRLDPLMNMAQRLIESLLFFHPAVWYVSRVVSEERENACDDQVLQSGWPRLQYASALVAMAELRLGSPHVARTNLAALAASGSNSSQFKRRVMRILGESNPPRVALSRQSAVLAVVAVGLACLLPIIAAAQTEQSADKEDGVKQPAGRVLLIEGWGREGEVAPLAQSLADQGLNVKVQSSSTVSLLPKQLAAYDSIILADVSRTIRSDAKGQVRLTDIQIRDLVNNTHKLGCGLVVLGGANSFDMGGWSGTELERAMPVNFSSSAAAEQGALVMIMHPGELKLGNSWQKAAARAAIEQLGFNDHCGFLQWTKDGAQWLREDGPGMVQVREQRELLAAEVGALTAGDLPSFQPALQKAFDELTKTDAGRKQVLLLTDGDPVAPQQALLQKYVAAGIPITVVHVDIHGPTTVAVPRSIAKTTGGKYYYVQRTAPHAIEKIFTREARRVSSRSIFETDQPMTLRVTKEAALTNAVPRTIPTVAGIVKTDLKNSPSANASIVTEVGGSETPVLATWTYGVGRTAVLTTDVISSWTHNWQDWKQRDPMITDLVRWSLKRQ